LPSQLWDSIKTTLKKFSPETQRILKPIPLTAARKPASIQEHKSYSYALWDDSDFGHVIDGFGADSYAHAVDVGSFSYVNTRGQNEFS
jgi:hypothetical protein